MAVTTRQSNLLVAEDWTKVYQTFRNADFQSYDFQTLRKSMIDYLRLYYPEDFNDFIESSEFIALIDLISFLGQSLAFRGDLNARENFIDTAQRRDSVLKLARLISYNPKRNIAASGFLKIDSVSTTEQLFDSNGLNVSGLVINWNDSTNSNWLEQFTIIVNASLNSTQIIGKPSNSQTINGVINDEYQINLIPGIVPTYGFSASVEGASTKFEIVSPTSVNRTNIYECNPTIGSAFNLLYRNDNFGNSSTNTGFFLYFKQGALNYVDFNFADSIPNRIFSVNTSNINNTDVWLYSLNTQHQLDVLWESVPVVGNSNVIYNTLANKNIYQINSRAGDQIDLVFGDGAFANLPQGNFRLYYRVSNGLNYKITPDEVTGIVIPVNYVSRSGRTETINIRASLQYTVANSASRETVEDIRLKAPQQYYTQNRMVNGEDYNILPYTLYSNIVKVKAVNRTSSGISRYLDVIDTTGKYSSTNIFAQDGYLYADQFAKSFDFTFASTHDITRILSGPVRDILSSKELLQFFYSAYSTIVSVDTIWNFSTSFTNGITGYFFNSVNAILPVGPTISTATRAIRPGAIIKFYAGDNRHFNAQHQLIPGPTIALTDKYYIYVSVTLVNGNGTNNGAGNFSTGLGPVSLSSYVPTGAIVDVIFPAFTTTLSKELTSDATMRILALQDFGLRYDLLSYSWVVVESVNVDLYSPFSLSNAGDNTGYWRDASWIFNFQKVPSGYIVTYRGTSYTFESVNETDFYFDNTIKIYDPTTGLTVKDHINILKINAKPDSPDALGTDYIWDIHKSITEVDGYDNPHKIYITFADSNNDGLPDNPELFDLIVSPTTNASSKYIYFKNTYGYDNFVISVPMDSINFCSNYMSNSDLQLHRNLYTNGQLFYIPVENRFYQLLVSGITEGTNVQVYTLTEVFDYYVKSGRQNLYFQYRHNSPNYRRIDPSPNNIMDLYILTKQYSADYQTWIRDTSDTIIEPVVPTGESLMLEFSGLEDYKSISDSIIYTSAKFKPIFGAKSAENLRAIFKVVKNPNISISDNDIKTSIIAAINTYFNTTNWDFGDTFYFSELAAYLHQALVPNISSVVIVPASSNNVFGSLLQINANFNEIIISAATVDNIEIITAITAAQINQTGVI